MKLPFVPNFSSIGKSGDCFSLYFCALKNIVLNIMMMRFCWNCMFVIRIPNHKICIRSHSNSAFSWIHIEYFCCVCGNCVHKLVLCKDTCFDSLGPNNGEPILESIYPIRNFIKPFNSHSSLLRAESTVIATHCAYYPSPNSFHHIGFCCWVRAETWRHYIPGSHIPIFLPKFWTICS